MIKSAICLRGHDTTIVGRAKGRACKICATLRYKKWRENYPQQYHERTKNGGWRKRGIIKVDGSPFTIVDYDRVYQTQQGKCAGCGIHQSQLSRALNADHDHKTGVFRFLLCMNCNHALGSAQDSSIILRKLAELLEHHDGE